MKADVEPGEPGVAAIELPVVEPSQIASFSRSPSKRRRNAQRAPSRNSAGHRRLSRATSSAALILPTASRAIAGLVFSRLRIDDTNDLSEARNSGRLRWTSQSTSPPLRGGEGFRNPFECGVARACADDALGRRRCQLACASADVPRDEVEDVAPPISDRSSNFHEFAAGAAGALALDSPF